MDFKCVEFVEELIFGEHQAEAPAEVEYNALSIDSDVTDCPCLLRAPISAHARGRPDLSGDYDIATLTPLMRPAKFADRLALTDQEAQGHREGSGGTAAG